MRVLAADLWPGIALHDPNARYNAFLQVGRPRISGFIESALLYDDILVPADDYMSAAILVGVLGEKTVLELLDNEILRFFRIRGAIAYAGSAGNVHGLVSFSVLDDQKRPREIFADADSALNWALKGLNVKLDIPALSSRILRATREVELTGIMADISSRTHSTIRGSSELNSAFGDVPDLNFIPAIRPQDIRIYGGVGNEQREGKGDGVDIVLSVARCHLEQYAADDMRCDDVRTQTPIGQVLAANSSPNLGLLREFTNIPDVGELFLQDGISASDLVKLRSSASWKPFVEWFHLNCRNDPMAAAKAYIDLLKQVRGLDSVPGKLVRYLLKLGIGYCLPAVSPYVSAFDTFGVNQIGRSSPKYFVEHLEQLAKPQQEALLSDPRKLMI